MLALDSDAFIFNFENPNTEVWVLENGPWFIAQTPLLLRKWESGVAMEKFTLHKIQVWIKLWRIPIKLLTADGISRIASAIGKPLYMDKAIEERRILYARVCVKICLDEGLPNIVDVDIEGMGSIEIHVKYPWKPTICSICKQFGHMDKTVRLVRMYGCQFRRRRPL